MVAKELYFFNVMVEYMNKFSSKDETLGDYFLDKGETKYVRCCE